MRGWVTRLRVIHVLARRGGDFHPPGVRQDANNSTSIPLVLFFVPVFHVEHLFHEVF